MNRESYFAKKRRRDNRDGYLFMLPALLAFTVFVGLPLIMTFVLSTGSYNLIAPFEFNWPNNLKRLQIDKTFVQSLKNTIKYFFVLVPIHCIGALLLAFFVYQVRRVRLRNFFRNVIYYPTILTTTSIILVWKYMFASGNGVINYFVRLLGGAGFDWIGIDYYYLTVGLFSTWKFIGTTFLYYFVGMQNVPKAYYEAAEIDGASRWTTFRKITLPLITPTIFFVLVTNMIGVIQVFDEPMFLRNASDTKSLAVHIYETAFVGMRFGYAGLMSLILFVIILAITIIQFIVQRKWVVYDYE